MKKKYILKKNYEIEKILKKKKIFNSDFIIYFDFSSNTKFCFSVPKKFGNAVMRNKKRRQMKSIIHEVYESLPSNNYVIIFRKNALEKSHEDLNKSLKTLLKKIKA